MGHGIAVLLALALSSQITSYSDFPACERAQRRWEVDCLQAIYNTVELPEALAQSECDRISETVCPYAAAAVRQACPHFHEQPVTSPTFDRWLQRWERRWPDPPPPPPPPACMDGPNCV